MLGGFLESSLLLREANTVLSLGIHAVSEIRVPEVSKHFSLCSAILSVGFECTLRISTQQT